jgi:hypothetical protein
VVTDSRPIPPEKGGDFSFLFNFSYILAIFYNYKFVRFLRKNTYISKNRNIRKMFKLGMCGSAALLNKRNFCGKEEIKSIKRALN